MKRAKAMYRRDTILARNISVAGPRREPLPEIAAVNRAAARVTAIERNPLIDWPLIRDAPSPLFCDKCAVSSSEFYGDSGW
jgi:hypothetical protein